MSIMTNNKYAFIVKGVLHPEFFFNINFFHGLKFKYVHIHTLGGNIKKKKNSSWEVRDFTERPKIKGFSGVKNTAKINKDLGMSCYIQVKYNVFFASSSLLTM